MASPDSVGTTLFDAVGNTFFGEREDVKLAFDDTGTTVPEQAAPHGSAKTAQPLTLYPLAVPNTLLSGLHAGMTFNVHAVDVVGSIGLDATGHSEDDYYSFTANAGDLINIEVWSRNLTRITHGIDSTLSVFDPSGNRIAFDDDTFQGQDAALDDLTMPTTGTYTIEVDTFAPTPTTTARPAITSCSSTASPLPRPTPPPPAWATRSSRAAATTF